MQWKKSHEVTWPGESEPLLVRSGGAALGMKYQQGVIFGRATTKCPVGRRLEAAENSRSSLGVREAWLFWYRGPIPAPRKRDPSLSHFIRFISGTQLGPERELKSARNLQSLRLSWGSVFRCSKPGPMTTTLAGVVVLQGSPGAPQGARRPGLGKPIGNWRFHYPQATVNFNNQSASGEYIFLDLLATTWQPIARMCLFEVPWSERGFPWWCCQVRRVCMNDSPLSANHPIFRAACSLVHEPSPQPRVVQ